MTTVPVHEDFLPYVDGMFHVGGWHGALQLREIDVSRTPNPGRTAPSFTLLFQGPRDDVLPEGMRTITAADGRAFDVYVMPIHTPGREHQDYQVVFN